jgi:hypothetical protein
MTKSPSSSQPLPAVDFTIELFCRVDDVLREEKKPALAHLHPSEVVTIGLLQALKGPGYRAFYRWLRKELGHLFPRLSDSSARAVALIPSAKSLPHFGGALHG